MDMTNHRANKQKKIYIYINKTRKSWRGGGGLQLPPYDLQGFLVWFLQLPHASPPPPLGAAPEST